MTFVIGGDGGRPVYAALGDLFRNAKRVSIAVSYVQAAGWEMLRRLLNREQISSLRMLCTDQLGITDPTAVRQIIEAGADIRAFLPRDRVYHPKVYLAHQENAPSRYMLGSANLSKSAFTSAVEIDTSGDDTGNTLSDWFDRTFNDPNCAAPFDDARLAGLERAWDARLKSRLVYQRLVASERQAPVGGCRSLARRTVKARITEVNHRYSFANQANAREPVRNSVKELIFVAE